MSRTALRARHAVRPRVFRCGSLAAAAPLL